MLERTLETEVMDTFQEAVDYDAMDHQAVNAVFVDDLLQFAPDLQDVLDVGTGTAQIPIELCRKHLGCRIMAIDLAHHMLDIARYNLEAAGCTSRVQLAQVDAKAMPFADGMFDAVISNSIVHHIPEPREVLREMIRVVAPGGIIFVRDLQRPADEAQWQRLVDTYAADCNEQQRKMFGDSLQAALTLQEVQQLVADLGWDPAAVTTTSDRHWTWAGRQRS